MVIEIFWWILIVSTIGYLSVMMIITIGWFRINHFDGEVESPLLKVSVIVAVRNEEENIRQLLENLRLLDYPKEELEIIIVDDHSEDLTRKIIGAFCKEHRVDNIILGKPEKPGKKPAIEHGIELAAGELIVTTDGDCNMDPQWLNRLVAFYQHNQPSLTIGPVVYSHEKGFLQKFFSLDFLSLVASGAGSAGADKPFMGNGANLMFRRKLVKELKQNPTGDQYASGDDVFLIHKILEKKDSNPILFVKDQQAMVYTKPPGSISGFLKQRLRWASKAKGYRSSWAILVALSVLFFNLMLVITFAGGFYRSWIFLIYGLFVVLKYLIDLPLMHEFINFVNKRYLKRYILIFEFVYPFYIVFISFLSFFVKYEWKGRRGLK